MTSRNKLGRNEAIVTGSALLATIGVVVRWASDLPSDASLVPGWVVLVHVLAIILVSPMIIIFSWRSNGSPKSVVSVGRVASLVAAVTDLIALVAHVRHGSYAGILEHASFAVFFPAACWLPNAITNPTNTKENRA